MIQKLVSFLTTFLVLLIGFIPKGIAFEEIRPNDLIMVTKDPAFSEKKDFCKALITKFTDLLDKDYDSLTSEEKDIADQVYFSFVKAKICNAYLWRDTVETLDEIKKLPKDKISILLGWGYDEKDVLVDISEILKKSSKCKNASSFAEEVNCIRKNYQVEIGNNWKELILFVLKQKYRDDVKILSFKTRRFSEKLEKFSKNPDKPLCIFKSFSIECPYFHLEKKFKVPRLSFYGVLGRNLKEGEDISISESLRIYSHQTSQEDLESLKIEKILENIKKTEEFKKIFSKNPEDLDYLERECRRIYGFSSDEDVCLLKGKSLRVKNPEKSYIWLHIAPKRNVEECNRLFEFETRLVFNFTKEVVQWIEKEFVPRGYLRF